LGPKEGVRTKSMGGRRGDKIEAKAKLKTESKLSHEIKMSAAGSRH